MKKVIAILIMVLIVGSMAGCKPSEFDNMRDGDGSIAPSPTPTATNAPGTDGTEGDNADSDEMPTSFVGMKIE